MTELSFLIKLFLIPDIPITVRDLLVDRINEVEKRMTGSMEQASRQVPMPILQQQPMTHFPLQVPSTVAAMARHQNIPVDIPKAPAPEPVAIVAQTPAAAAAVQSRQASIDAALSGKVDKVSGRPKKW